MVLQYVPGVAAGGAEGELMVGSGRGDDGCRDDGALAGFALLGTTQDSNPAAAVAPPTHHHAAC